MIERCPVRRRRRRPTLGFYRLVPALTLVRHLLPPLPGADPGALSQASSCRKWPGALLVTVWWLATVALLPARIGLFGGYDLTYGSLAGVMIALMFFFVIGLGVVIGAELNAALAESGATR